MWKDLMNCVWSWDWTGYRCRTLPPVSRVLGERLKERQSGETGRSNNGWLSAQNQSSDDDEVMIVQVFLAGLAFSIQQQQVKKGEGGILSCGPG